MFSRDARYKTQGIDRSLSEQLQIQIWQILDRDLDEGTRLDYLQVFELFKGNVEGKPVQHVRQRQEQPKRKILHTLTGTEKPVSNLTVWIIDDGTHCTMLLPEEY